MRLHEHTPLKGTPLALRLLIAALVAGAVVLWVRHQPAQRYDVQLVQHCLRVLGADVRRDGPRTLTIDGELALRFDANRRVLTKGHDPRINSCLDRVAGAHLRLLP